MEERRWISLSKEIARRVGLIMKYLLDPVILIDHLNNVSSATQWLKVNSKHSFISVITRAEILVGFKSEESEIIKKLLNQFKILPITQVEADIAAELRQIYKWKLPDAFQAAIAQNHKLMLITRNSKDFSPHIHPFVLIPYSLCS